MIHVKSKRLNHTTNELSEGRQYYHQLASIFCIMGDNPDIAALYPPPPPFYKFFTCENVSTFNSLRQSGKSDKEISEITRYQILDKYVGLKESGVQQIYDDASPPSAGSQANTSTTENVLIENVNKDTENIENEEEIEEVFSGTRIDELKKMTKSLLLNYLELVGLLAKNPALAQPKIDHIRTILINIHHLLNSYRLHQSRETLIIKLQKKLEETKTETLGIHDTCSRVEKKLDQLVNRLEEFKAGNKANSDGNQ
ncbi:hypothetical protein JL09_g3626 [Pichia kudriavzevii]|uniref:Mediator of RNA polymerase II transcription subunit 7 n=1 Tax=Pichia kudriavzevii TaxID=4909 RepID=A0A099NWN6_PICKU|nr:hypothetical protein JL09_g3626 [Pichia kudriavzevii]